MPRRNGDKRAPQKPLSDTQAWTRMERSMQGKLRRNAQGTINDAVKLLRDQDDGKRKKYREFLQSVLDECGPVCVAACVVGLGQTIIANMNREARSKLLLTVKEKASTLAVSSVQSLALQELHPRPEIAPLECSFNILSVHTLEHFVASSFLDVLYDSPIRVWEVSKQEIEMTQIMQTRLPWLGHSDALIFFDVGHAQQITEKLFPGQKSVYSSDRQIYRGALVEEIRAFCGGSIYEAIDISQLRQWEKQVGRSEITECIELELRDQNSGYGILKVRIQKQHAVHIVNTMYS